MFDKRGLFLPGLIFFIFAFCLRLPTFGDPILHIDEDWYLYVGGQMLHGFFPYTDLWDRKPFGLFALYAVFNLFGDYRFLAYQIGALCSVCGTAVFIMQMGRKLTSQAGGIFAGLFYIAVVNCFEGWGGQSPVFYNCLVAAAFSLIVLNFEKITSDPSFLLKKGWQAMLLFGFAMQIKPTCAIDGVYLGIWLLFICWEQNEKWRIVLQNAALWVTVACLPTAFIALGYFFTGNFSEWFFANISILHKEGILRLLELKDFYEITLFVFIVLIACSLRYWREKTSDFLYEDRLFMLMCGWACLACLALIPALSSHWPHYFLPALLPVSIFFAYLAQKEFPLKILSILVVLFVAELGLKMEQWEIYSFPPSLYQDVKKLIGEKEGCLFSYNTYIFLGDINNRSAFCHLTKYPFPAHLGAPSEQNALGVDEKKEIRKILLKVPRWIAVNSFSEGTTNALPEIVLSQDDIVSQALREHYHKIYTSKYKGYKNFALYEYNFP